MNKNKNLRGIGVYVVMLAVIIIVLTLLFNNGSNTAQYTYSDIMGYFRDNQVKSFVVDGGELTMRLHDGKVISYDIPYLSMFVNDVTPILEKQAEDGVEGAVEQYDYLAPAETPWWVSFIPYVVLFGLVILFWFFMMKSTGGGQKAMSFGKARTKYQADNKKKITFADVAGAEEEKAELQELVDFLKDPKKYIDIGARIPKGVLLVGPPGTGKTYLAKAVAGEAGVPFLSISGSDFVEMYVGVGASRVRDLFDQAKKAQPAIVFIDEIDAVGRQRGAGLGGGHDEREQTLNQLLVEMDGFTTNEGVIIIAATNRPDILDSALLRPGRFDRQVYIGLPDIRAREAILKIHARGKKMAADVDMSVIARMTAGFSPASLENLLNEAALLAARRNDKDISNTDISDAVMKIIVGTEKKTKVITEKERRLTAFHEAGHAIVSRFLPTQPPVHEISIIPRTGGAGGYTMFTQTENEMYSSKLEMEEEISGLLGGRISEKIFIGDITTGASSDLTRATDIAKQMVTRYGMSEELGPIVFSNDSNEIFLGRDFGTTHGYSEQVAAKIDAEIKRLMDEAYKRADDTLRAHAEKVNQIAGYLIEHEKMDADTFNSFFAPGEGTAAVGEMFDKK